MIQDYNLQVDFDQIPVVRKRCLAKIMAKGWSSQEAFDAGLPPDIVEYGAESFEMNAAELAAKVEQLQKHGEI